MKRIIEVSVPDIGDFNDVPVVDILVKTGQRIERETSLITLESEKSTMEIPSSHAGTVKSVRVKVGDKVSQGSEILTLEVEDTQPQPAPEPATAPEPTAAHEIRADVVVLGAGPGGYTAAFRAADLGKKVVLIERHAALGAYASTSDASPPRRSSMSRRSFPTRTKWANMVSSSPNRRWISIRCAPGRKAS